MQVSNLFAIKTFLCILLKTSAQCGFAIMCFITCLQFLTGRKAAFYRCRSDGELVGSIAYFAGQNSTPDGWILCNGSAISRTTYAALFSAIGITYGTGDGSTTFVLPNLINKFIEGSSMAGTPKEAGLPNIKGAFELRKSGTAQNIWAAGGFVINIPDGGGAATTSDQPTGAANNMQRIEFDASRSSSIYGKASTVQPPALTMKPFIYTGKTVMHKWTRTA